LRATLASAARCNVAEVIAVMAKADAMTALLMSKMVWQRQRADVIEQQAP